MEQIENRPHRYELGAILKQHAQTFLSDHTLLRRAIKGHVRHHGLPDSTDERASGTMRPVWLPETVIQLVPQPALQQMAVYQAGYMG